MSVKNEKPSFEVRSVEVKKKKNNEGTLFLFNQIWAVFLLVLCFLDFFFSVCACSACAVGASAMVDVGALAPETGPVVRITRLSFISPLFLLDPFEFLALVVTPPGLLSGDESTKHDVTRTDAHKTHTHAHTYDSMTIFFFMFFLHSL